jgi:sulfonate transport system permease protein
MALGLWWAIPAMLDLNPFFAKRPDDVVRALVLAPDAGETRATLLAALAETACS